MTDEEELEALRKLPSLSNVPENTLKLIATVSELQHFETGEFIIREGECGDDLYVLVEGAVDFLVEGRDGPVELSHEVTTNNSIGVLGAFSNNPHTHSVRTTEPTRALKCPKQTAIELIRETPVLAFNALAVFSERWDNVVRLLRDMRAPSSKIES